MTSALDAITQAAVPTLREAFGIGVGLRGRDDDRGRRQPDPRPLRSGVREAVRRLPDSGLEWRDSSAPTLSRRPPPGERRALPHRHRPHAMASADDGLRRHGAPPRA